MNFLHNISAFDPSSLMGQLDLIVRLVLACICGGVIGFERSRRLKDAGIRTHVVVALGAALIIMVSKYGFYDIASADGVLRADVGRVAAQVVSGIGFLGAGIIYVKRGAVKGLTTAAGVWTTAGIGLAFGAGMYLLGIVATLLMMICQAVLHKFFNKIETVAVIVKLVDTPEVLEKFKTSLTAKRIHIESCALINRENGEAKFKVMLLVPENMSTSNVSLVLTENEDVLSFTTADTVQDD